MSDVTNQDTKLIKKFCDTGDTLHLRKLSRYSALIFQKIAAYSLTQTNTDQDTARKVLRYYKRGDDGRKTIEDADRKKAEERVSKMSTAVTGARSGDVLTGASKATNGALLKIHGDVNIPPEERRLDSIRAFPDLWHIFLVKLGSIPFFTDMSLQAREYWLDFNEVDNESSIGTEGSGLELTQPGNSDFVRKLSDEEVDKLIQGNPDTEDGFWSKDDIEGMMPRKPGSNAVRHTLILLRSFWKIAMDYEVVKEFGGLVLNFENPGVLAGVDAGINQEIYVVSGITESLKKHKKKWVRKDSHSIGIISSKSRTRFEDVSNLVNRIRDVDLDRIRRACKGFTPASYKSLIQKIIRFRPDSVDLGQHGIISAHEAILGSMALLAVHPRRKPTSRRGRLRPIQNHRPSHGTRRRHITRLERLVPTTRLQQGRLPCFYGSRHLPQQLRMAHLTRCHTTIRKSFQRPKL